MSALLFPNFGAEEGEPAESPSGGKAKGKTVLAPLWALLFERSVVALDEAPLEARPSWLGAGQADAAFPWLGGVSGLVPWLSTSRAEARAKRLSLPVFGPPPDVTRRLSDKAWALQVAREEGLVPDEIAPHLLHLEPTLLRRPDEAVSLIESHLRAMPAWVTSYTLKPRLGSSGRGRVAGTPPRVDDRARASFERLASRGGALVEPWLTRTRDLSVQLVIGDENVTVLATTEQILRPSGVYEGNRGVVTDEGVRSGTPFDDALLEAGRRLGERARKEGFRGPCGVDAFAFLIEGREVLRPVVELNARFTTGTIAVGLVERARREGRLRAGDRWQFGICPPEGGFAGLPGAREVLPLEVGGAALAVLSA